MKHVPILIALSLVVALTSCKKEVIEKQETTVEKTVYITQNAFMFDTLVGTSNTWPKRRANEHWKSILHDSVKQNRVVSVSLGNRDFEWLNLPYVNMQDNIAINYFWRDGEVVVMAYGDSGILNSTTYWVQFKDYIKVSVAP